MPEQIQNAYHKFITLTFLLECWDLREYIVNCYIKKLSLPEKNCNKVSTLELDALFLAFQYLFLLHTSTLIAL